jgi:large subunit ribosomal protein L29
MKFAELKDLTLPELSARSNELRRELFNLRLQKASAQLEKTARVRTLRKDIARIETALTQRRNSQTTAP